MSDLKLKMKENAKVKEEHDTPVEGSAKWSKYEEH